MATRYWVGGTGNWSSTTKWSLTSGGVSGASVPISTDDVIFDANSGLANAVATVDTAQTCATLTLTPSATAGASTIAITVSLTVTGLFSMSGTAGNQRFLIRSTTFGLATNFIVGSASGLSDLDFRDLFVTGAASPLSGTRIGNLQGVTGVTFSTAKSVYWNLAGTQNWTSNGWAATSGGTPATTNYPLAQDTAVFNNAGSVGNLTASGIYTGTVDMSSRSTGMTLIPASLTVYGNWKNGSVATMSGGLLTFSGRNTQTITSAGQNIPAVITINTFGGTVQLADALNMGANILTVTNGTFTTNGYNVTAGSLTSSDTTPRTINLGASTLTLSGSTPISFVATNLTFNAGTTTINLTGTVNISFSGAGQTFNNVNFNAGSTYLYSFTGANTFANLYFLPVVGSTGILTATFAANQIITGTLTCSGASAVRRFCMQASSTIVGTQRTLTVGTIIANDCDFRDIAIAGTAAGSSPTRAGDCGGNSGINFPAAKSVYWNLAGTQNWTATAWASSSGGTPDVNNFPLAQDTAVFDGVGASAAVTINQSWNIGSFDARFSSGFSLTISVGFGTVCVYGDWKLGGSFGYTGPQSSALYFCGRNTQTISSVGVQWGNPIVINSTSTVQLADALTMAFATHSISLNSGTFDAVSYNVTTAGFGGSGSVNSTLKMGSGTWTLTGAGGVFNNNNNYITVYKGTANIILSDSTNSSARNITASGVCLNKVTIGGGAATAQTLTFVVGMIISELASTKTVAFSILFPATVLYFGKWSVTGTVGNVVTVTGATIYIVGPRVSDVNYLAMGTTAIGVDSPGEFYAGANSTGTGAGVILTAAPAPVTRYWRGGTGTWDATTTTNWSATSGGGGGASVPTSADNVIFNSASNATAYTVTCTATQLRCGALTMAGPASGNITWAGTAGLAIHGDTTIASGGVTVSYTGLITLTGSSTQKYFTTNNITFSSSLQFQVWGIGCVWSLNGNLTSTNSAINMRAGSFSVINSSGSSGVMSVYQILNEVTGADISITLGSGNHSIASISLSSNINQTLNAGTSTVSISGAGGLDFGSLSWNNVVFTSSSFPQSISGNNTFVNFTTTARSTTSPNVCTLYGNQTITGTLTIRAASNATCRLFFCSNTIGTTRTISVGTFAAGASDIDFRDIAVTGAAAPISGTRFGNCKGNSGITFSAGVNKYWNLAAGGNWSAVGWATTGGGTPAVNNFPLAQDTAIFQSTGLNSGASITLDAAWQIGTIDMSARTTNTMTLATGTNTPSVYGNWVTGTGVTFSGTGVITFAGQSSQTITSAGRTYTQPFTINSPGGSVSLVDSLVCSAALNGAIAIITGTFDANGQNVTLSAATSSVLSSGTGVRTIAVGSGTWTIAGTAGWAASTSINLTVTGTGTIRLTSVSAKTFAGGGLAYTNITLDNGGAGTLTITGNNTLKNISNTYGATGATTINFAATSTTVSQFTAAGTSGKLLTISGTSAASPATIILTGGTVNTDYVNISNVKAYNNSTWYAGTHSTNVASLGWIFAAAPIIASVTNSFFLFF